MQLRKIVLALLFTSIITPAYAMFCPSGFNEINIGDSTTQVIAQCGQPTSQETKDAAGEKPEEWVYYLGQGSTDPSQPQQASLRTTIAFNKGVVSNISVNGIGVSNTQICAGNTIQIGTKEEAVKQACGDPQFINKSDIPVPKADQKLITTFIYTGSSISTLTFENGLLKSKS